MNDRIVSNHTESRPEVDDILRDYFQAQMPHPWPACRMPSAAPARRVGSFWSRYTGRLALAASVAVLVGGYLTLANYFPPQQVPNSLERAVDGAIGLKEKKARPTPSTPPNIPSGVDDNGADRVVPMPIPNRNGGKSSRKS